MRSIDNFGRHFVMKLDGDASLMTSYMGSILTLMLTSTVLFYFVVKVKTIVQKQDVDVFGYVTDHQLTYEDKFDADQGFFVAAGITSYDDNKEFEEDPSKYGSLEIEHWGWGYEETVGSDFGG